MMNTHLQTPRGAATAPDSRACVITTHINADFDALASMMAAQKLYPGAVAVLHDSSKKRNHFFVDSMAYLFNMRPPGEIASLDVGLLVLVDVCQASRIGKMSYLLEKKDIEIHIYDHHPKGPGDIRADYRVQRDVGATVTILTGIIREKGLPLSPEEATALSLGIYEDTGSFTFSSTTAEDFKAAAFLASKGASLSVISDLMSGDINPRQVSVLNDLIHSSKTAVINGVEIVIASIFSDHYIQDFAWMVQKMVKMENINAIFAIALMDRKVYVVGRSRIPEVDVGTALKEMGGGGHPFAAAASIKDRTPAEVEIRLLDILKREVEAIWLAGNMMSSPAITAGAGLSCEEAGEIMTRYNINAVLVTGDPEFPRDGRNLSGIITRQVIGKALFHKLGDARVSEYMSTEIQTVRPDSGLKEIQDKIIDHNQRILPVVEDGEILGVVTRTDLLKTLIKKPSSGGESVADPHREPTRAPSRNVSSLMRERLSKRVIGVLEKIGEIARREGFGAYVAGGFVRDLFLFRKNEDMDIVIEGDGIAFARKYAALSGARVHSHKKFGTAVIIFPDGFKIDVASARLEFYKYPAAMPTVRMSSIKLDLFRRDFTINTLAIQLNPGAFGALIDFFSGRKDIKKKTVRVLHNLSFVEDPTRVFRAIRFEQRFGFKIGKLTSGLIENAVAMDFFKRLSGRRVFNELRQILEEENPLPAVSRMADYGLLSVIDEKVALTDSLSTMFKSVHKVLSWYELLFLEESYMKWTVYFIALTKDCDEKTCREICRRYEAPMDLEKLFCEDRFEADRRLREMARGVPGSNSGVRRLFFPFRTEIILYMMAAARTDEIKRAISLYFTRLRYVDISVAGKDIKKAGLPPGPEYREILDRVLDARLDGRVQTRKDEIALIEKEVVRRNKKAGKAKR
ncbi:putative tRNA nucleotidyltransferase (CCA-adding enzyme) [Candidatus Desulfarcum epimagneticum]|uniref:Putative tRNA nucleotidyltransferase (CCA-adding enzyme) n=1 Tax=uncultured Desulfobacteraceae bacterium TaxID=218296 RepID=A0A484HG68_9BACT|nr:putative tRNA nucleotidyltransferase (CCA-adding enzyme) [uncultured Desulfobacteraceae bacterium]